MLGRRIVYVILESWKVRDVAVAMVLKSLISSSTSVETLTMSLFCIVVTTALTGLAYEKDAETSDLL